MKHKKYIVLCDNKKILNANRFQKGNYIYTQFLSGLKLTFGELIKEIVQQKIC